MPIFDIQSFCEFDKMQVPYSDCVRMLIFCIWFVWRRPEFAFLCADFGRRTFFKEKCHSIVAKDRKEIKNESD